MKIRNRIYQNLTRYVVSGNKSVKDIESKVGSTSNAEAIAVLYVFYDMPVWNHTMINARASSTSERLL